MGLFSKDIRTFNDLFIHQLRDIYYAERQLVKALPKMIDKATSPDLKQGLTSHLAETREHVKRLERVFDMIGEEPSAIDCPAIDGIIKEASEIMGDVEDKNVLDAAIIAAGQAAEHYEMTRYGTLIAWAKQIGRQDAADIFAETLEEEKAADEKLTQLAEGHINMEAAV
ncbi:MAG TPA: ferritin-like domain-containing protein [Bauldia sp.]|nr:ferritin-like domain-containing protein [Bauldia sp.]